MLAVGNRGDVLFDPLLDGLLLFSEVGPTTLTNMVLLRNWSIGRDGHSHIKGVSCGILVLTCILNSLILYICQILGLPCFLFLTRMRYCDGLTCMLKSFISLPNFNISLWFFWLFKFTSMLLMTPAFVFEDTWLPWQEKMSFVFFFY